jgi:hypothetical protein
MTLAYGTTPAEGIKPTTPQLAAGIRILSPPSVAWVMGTIPDATAAAAPPAQPFAAPRLVGARGPDPPRHGDGPPARDHTEGQHDKTLAPGGRIQGQGQWSTLSSAHHPAPPGGKAGLHAPLLALGAPLALGGIVPGTRRLSHRLLVALHPLGQQVTDRSQGARAGKTMPKRHRANTVAWGWLQGDRSGLIVVRHGSKPVGQNMASLLGVVGYGAPHHMPLGGKS